MFFVHQTIERLNPFGKGIVLETEPLKEYDFKMGDAFQIYSVRNRSLYKHVNLDKYVAPKARAVVFEKWLRPVLDPLEGKTFCVHLGDRPCDEIVEDMPNLCFCKKKSDDRHLRLIPDPYYQGQKGYVKSRRYRQLYKSKWEKKIEKVIFRGAYTGEKPLEKNMRAQLCLVDSPLIDAKLTGVNNDWETEEIKHLLGNQMSRLAMAKYKYQVDIDGNTNSWDGFFWKLMSGSLTFKMSSEWCQWYYHQLLPGIHYVEFSDLDELTEKLMFYKTHDEKAYEIALNAQKFTKAFKFKDQYIRFLEAISL